jgi:hypothetical protein
VVNKGSKSHRFGKRVRRFDSPRRQRRADLPVAFIFDERASGMVNRWCEAAINQRTQTVPA